MSPTSHPSVNRKVATACGAAVLLLVMAGCGSDEGKDADTSGQTADQGGPQTEQGSGPDGRFPGASGKVAAVDGRTAQVQGMDGQVAVTWTGTTTFTKEVSATRSDVRVGTCVVVGSDAQPSSSGAATSVTATAVRITTKTGDSCTAGMPGPGGPGGGSGDGGPELDATPPEGASPGGDRPMVRALGGAIGEVTAVSATGFTVAAVQPGSDEPTAVSVTVDGDTTYTTNATAEAADVEVGVCVTATGTSDDTGAVTAKTLAVSPPRDGQCGGVLRFQSSDGAGTSGQES
jgi:hypothetical protein